MPGTERVNIGGWHRHPSRRVTGGTPSSDGTGWPALRIFCEPGEVPLAHQGGWDEILLVGIPIAGFALLLWLANRRAAARMRHDRDRSESESR